MDWKPITLDQLEGLIADELAECSEEQRSFFARTRFAPSKWRQSPRGDMGGGFWAVATMGDRVLWFNDIEEGFNVSQFSVWGKIPADQYWCNQDPLKFALPSLAGADGGKFGPPRGM